ncbi:hypothetical protein [Mycobacteroides abscessus]|uniref:hypothetical protein n=1 Tax=Mycobacteroides abscessus TaxID=36809 RepID=UPI000926545F|nr:hypothetical protein [Mycobacteroides abscessus]QST89656.1 polymorphic toxin protein [Mycobacterium phage prophi62-3]QST89999.1 polymorphic toxin protein [Mycobacterium phage prophi108-1]SHV96950.1 Alpha/beta hydrolase of uncharacterised function (DUF1023) [Mycobacteroides abscessus subsp. abscessus]SHW76173.1 Alpha/beta hydrolase of uncharacterised function (DUF1023) [Mycobacteroides abscessus subsp. abscessus]SII05432.1 Alpha/beta hydrolase of uncharacterised function (DUF1023) [Mycobacte
MSLTPADLKKVDVQMIRDVAAALEKQATSLSDIKNSFPNLPHVGNWTGVAATTADTELGVFGKLIGTHSEGRQAAAAKMREAADEFEAAKAKLSKIENEARGKFSIDYATGAVKPLSDKPEAAQQAAELTDAIKRAVADGDAADATLTHAVNLADGDEKPSSLPVSMTGILGELDRIKSPRENQEFAFREVFKRAPTTPADWHTAAMLDAHNYDPKYKGVESDIKVAKIEPQPGKGQVQINAFIPGEKVWNFGKDRGDNRGFDRNASPEHSRVSMLVDFDNGAVIHRQNPSVNADTGAVAVGTNPDVSVKQKGNALNIQYESADGFLPGGLISGQGSFHTVKGDIALVPTDSGIQVGGTVTSFPALEIYHGDQAAVQYMPSLGHNEFGPLFQLPMSHSEGDASLVNQFHVPTAAARGDIPIATPGTQLGPTDRIPTVPVG